MMVIHFLYTISFFAIGNTAAEIACGCPDSFSYMQYAGDNGWCFCCPATPNTPNLNRDKVIAEGYCCALSFDNSQLLRPKKGSANNRQHDK
jgi:hypothetical protein